MRTLRIDGGHVYGMSAIETFCAQEGFTILQSTPHNQYQNGVAESAIGLVQDQARATMIQMRIPTCFWDIVLKGVSHTLNNTDQSDTP